MLLLVVFFLLDPNLSQAELMLMTISEIISQLVDAHEKKKDVNLNRFPFYKLLCKIIIYRVSQKGIQIWATLATRI